MGHQGAWAPSIITVGSRYLDILIVMGVSFSG